MKAILESQGGGVLEVQINTLPDNFVANPRRISLIQRVLRIFRIPREKRIRKSMSRSNYEYEHAFNAVLEYGFDWTDSTFWASGDRILTSSWASSSGSVVLGNQSSVNGIVSVEPTGMLKDKIYKFTNTVVTVSGKTDSRTLVISCKAR